MNEEEIKMKICSELKKIAPDTEPEKLMPDEVFREVLDIDSFDTLRLIVALSESFGVDIPESDYGKITTLKKLTGYLLMKKQS